MANKLIFYIFLLYAYFQASEFARIDLKICSKTGSEDICQQLVRQNELACNENFHSVDCLLNIENERSHIGRISEEEAFLASNLISDNVQVIGEIVNIDNAPSQTVIIAKNEILGSSSDLKSILRNKKFCHPGFKHDDAFSFYLLQELENLVIDDNELCNNNDGSTLVENRIRALSNFLGDSCRPGPWSQDLELDRKLKSKYNSLCKLCNDNSNCNQDYKDPFHDTLSCLTNQNGDFVLTTLSEAKKFLESSFNTGKYKYLCKDGSSKTDPCPWTEPLPSLIVAEKNRVDDVITIAKKYLGNKLRNATSSYSAASDSVGSEAFIRILNLGRTETVQLLGTPKSLSEYVKERRPSPKLEDSKKCNLAVKWCTRSAGEQAKCEWYSQAARNRAIQPVIECKQSENEEELSCLDDIETNKADIVTTSADHAFLTLKKGLTSVTYPETDTRTLATILLVKHASNGAINNINDLKGKKACFPQYGGKEYITFIEAAKSHNAISPSSCKYEEDFNDFVGPSCVPGVGNEITESREDTNVNVKLCELCKPASNSSTSTVCSEDKRNLYYGSRGSLQCMKDNAADFAVVTKPIRDNENYTDLQVICRNGSIAKYPGLDVDDDCALNVIISGEVVIKQDNAQKQNIILILEESERWFGQDFNKPFQLFDRFNNTKDYLFRDSTLGLTYRDEQSLPKFVQNYKNLLKNAETCFLKPEETTNGPGGDDDTTPSGSAPIAATMMLIVAPAFTKLIF